MLPNSLYHIHTESFSDCSKLLDVYCYAQKAPSTEDAFNNSYPEYATLHVPASALDSYISNSPWSSFGTVIALGEEITEIILDPTSVTLTEGEALPLVITTTPDDADMNLISWSSSNPSVATVDSKGKVTAVAPGTTTITATANDGSDVSASCGVTVVPASYVVTYLVDGDVFATDTLVRGESIEAIAEPVKEGYTFSGWSKIPEIMPANDITIEGAFVVNKYLVTFKAGDEVITSDSLEYGTVIVVPDAPMKEGYTFNGWSDVAETVPAGDVTYEGSYTINKYLVTFKIGDEVITANSLEYGAKIVAPEAPVKEGYTFNGWGEVAETVPAGDVTYEGSYTVNSYLLSYTVDGETVQADSVAYGTAITLLDEPAKEGYTFSGWSEAPETMPANDVTISSTFIINRYLVTFKIDSKVIAADSLEYGSTIVAPEAPAKEGYTFDGWGEVAETVPAGDVTYEGTYTVNIYKVYYYVGEELVHTAEVAYGEAIPEYIYEPTTAGDVFEGWVGETYETMPAHDVTYVANITNDIDQLTNGKGQLTIYNLMGRKVLDTENLKGGVYIVNGRKVVIR